MSEGEREPELRDLAAAYALGALDPAERAAFEALLASSPELRLEVDAYRELGGQLAYGAPVAEPPPALRERVLAGTPQRRASAPVLLFPGASETPGTPASARRSRVPHFVLAGLAASVALVAWLGIDRARLQEELGARERALAAREALLREREAALEALTGPGVEVYRLTGTTAEPAIQLFWHRERRIATISAVNLPAPAPGRTYQLWFLRGKEAIPSVTFRVDAAGRALVRQVAVPEDGKPLTAAAVTVEPDGGSPVPTSQPILVGALTRG